MPFKFTTDSEALRKIDQEISEHEAIVITLKKHRNTRIAINQLPIDILRLIFVFFKEECPYRIHSSSADWTTVLRVCSHWRNIITSTPRFWTTVSLADLRTVPATLQYSCGVPLQIFCPLDVYYALLSAFWDALETVLLRSERFQTFTLVLPPDNARVERFTTTLGARRLPCLHTMELRSSTFSRALHRTFPWTNYPSLRFLILTDVIIVSDIPEFPTLVKLSILTNEYSPFTWILALLQKSPNIEEVDVAGVTTLDASDILHPARPTSLISLPKLRSMEVSVKKAAAVELFDYIDIPDSARVTVNLATPRVRSKTEKLAVRSALKSLCIRLASLYYGTSLERMEILMNDNASNCDLNWFSSCSDCPLISVHLLSRSVKLSEYFQYFQSNLPVFNVSELTIVDNSTCGTWKSSDIIPSFQDIRVLNFKGCTDITLLHVFTSIGNVDVNGIPNRSLEVLSLVSVDLKSFDKEGSPKHSVCAAFFERRRQVGKPIHKLTIRNCTVSPQCVDAFRGCVEVDWDGVQEMKKNA